MNSDKKEIWILAGYELFADFGPSGLKVEVLSRKVQKNKSSFYHHFADLDIFTDYLLNFHIKRAELIAIREKECANVIPQLIEVLVDCKTDLLFNRQLRINRNIKRFKTCFENANKTVGVAMSEIWAEELGLKDNHYLAEMVLNLSLENFYLQITKETLNYEWLSQYVVGLSEMVKEFKNMKKRELDANV